MTCGVYEIWCGPHFYQGSSKNIEARWVTHRRALTLGNHGNPKFQAAYDKYGWTDEAILVECEEHTLLVWEQDYIDANWGDEKYLNLNPVADRPPQTPETRAKMSAAAKSRVRGPLSEEHKSKISAAQKGVPKSPEHRAKLLVWWGSPTCKVKMSAVAKGNQHWKGRTHSAESKAKMSSAGMGRKHTDEAKAKNAAAHAGKKATDEARAKMSAAHKGKPKSEAQRAKLRAYHARRRAEKAERNEILALFGMEGGAE